MSYQALYRQWRPQDFDEIIGQNHIVIPLKNQIMSNSYGHAYIFSGTRGTGKTSTAKIFARAVNCLNNTDGNPCNQCSNCLSILEDQFIDVVEMDAASNNSVDDIRELREHIKFAPSKGKYKVYIIDEVHMLSQGAFNALLKTLEEPPEYVLFILATTELHKIPATILSRCQRFDFKRVSFEEILVRLEHICKELGIAYEVEALKLIIQKSDGAVRDTLSSLDQCLSIKENRITVSDVVNILGVVEKTQILTLVQFLESEQSGEVLLTVDNILKHGKDVQQFVNAMIEVYRDVLILKMVKENHASLIDASTEYIESIRDVSLGMTSNHISRSLDLLIELSKNIKYAQNKRALLEATLIKMIYAETSINLESILERLEKIESKLSTGNFNVAHKQNASKTVEDIETLKQSEAKDTHKQIQEPIESFIELTDKDISLNDIVEIWDAFLAAVSAEKKSLIPALQGSKPYKLMQNKCIVALHPANKLFKSILANPTNSDYLNKLMTRMIKKVLSLEFDVIDQDDSSDDKEAQIRNFFKEYNDVLEIK